MNNDQSTTSRPPVLAWAVVHNADMALTQSAVIAEAWRKAGLEVIPLAPTGIAAAQAHAPQAPATPVEVLCFIRAAATLPERNGFEACRSTDAGAMAVLSDGFAFGMPTATPEEFAATIEELLAAPAAPAKANEDARDVIRLLMAAASDAGHLLCMTAKQQKEMRDQTVASINIALAAADKALGGAA